MKPDEQLKKFKLPPGFEIQLVVSEPDIGQPMNIQFDARGRLWVTSSIDYPYPATSDGVELPRRFPGVGKHAPRDRLTVLEGIGDDGKPAKISNFAEGLNLPVGHTPLGDGGEALVYAIPSIYRVTDTDGDGKADTREAVYSRFGNQDTHGNSNGYRRWLDGWIYGCHGFANHSEVKDGEGNTTVLDSGNTYRFREDGSHFERFTWGQVNPYGLTFDPLGNMYSSDCHSMPIYMLLRGAVYPHFGSTPDSLGFGPTMIDHSHGSTGICGPAWYSAEHFPADYRENVFICNPVTSRVHRDKVKQFGSTYKIDTQPDFITCDDLWFRPVDAQVGPDGALYIADFHNAVIGHYEAPLDHPRRDRETGRVWRIVRRGEDGKNPSPKIPDLTKLSLEELVQKLGDVNLNVRILATNYLVDKHATDAPAAVRKAIESTDSPTLKAHGAWVLERTGGLDDVLVKKLAGDGDVLVRVHLQKLLAEREQLAPEQIELVRAALNDENAFVVRAAADALGEHPRADNVPLLIAKWTSAPAEDTHLIHMLKLALRRNLRHQQTVTDLITHKFDDATRAKLVEITAISDSPIAAPILIFFADPSKASTTAIDNACAADRAYGTPEQLAKFTELAPQWFAGDVERQAQTLIAICDGLEQKGIALDSQTAIRDWFAKIAPAKLEALCAGGPHWTAEPVKDLPASKSPYGVKHRESTDGNATAMFWDSIANGEQLTGVLRSQPFKLPETFSFWMCGHNGMPGTDPEPVNYVRLVLADTGEVIAKQTPPRNDTAQKYEWTLKEHAGKQVVFELIDGFRATGYAWLAAGRFEPAVIRVPSADSEKDDARLVSLTGRFGLKDVSPRLCELAAGSSQPVALRVAAIESADKTTERGKLLTLLTTIVARGDEPAEIRAKAAGLLGAIDAAEARTALTAALAQAPTALERDLALALCQNQAGMTALVDALAAGKASTQLLNDPNVAELLSTRAADADKARVAELKKNLPAADQRLAQLIALHRKNFTADKASAERGRELFTKHCGNCHRVGSEGAMVGPQLDGVGNRGIDRVLGRCARPEPQRRCRVPHFADHDRRWQGLHRPGTPP